jgi:hypothetical protein
VRVVSIEPRLADDHLELKLIIGARTDEGKLEFLKALESSRSFSDIEVLGETRAGEVVMALNARYSVT